jgi:polyisoprenoid-binding protein YceI
VRNGLMSLLWRPPVNRTHRARLVAVVLGFAAAAPAAAQTGVSISRDGLWRVVPAESFVGYRVRERLGFLPAPSDAVGRTSAIVGTARIREGRIVSTVVTTDLRTLKSDESRRDGVVRSRLGKYPQARFRLTAPIRLPDVPDGQTFTFSARANLTIHGVTRAVIFPLQARWSEERLQVIGKLRVRFSDYRIGSLRVGPVLSISKFATIEVQLSFAST